MPVIGMQPWTPKLITTEAWYDAADLSTITEAAGAVSQFDDKSGNARHLNQVTEAQKPLFSVDTVTFGLDDNMDFATALPSSYYIAVVGAPRVNTALRTLLYTTVDEKPFAIESGSNLVGFVNTTFGYSPHEWAEGERALFGGVMELASNGYRKNGDLSAVIAPATPPNNAAFAFGGNAGTNSEGFGDINEAVIVATPISTETTYLIDGYLAWKWGLVDSLPEDHPFKYRPPMDSSLAFAPATTRLWTPNDVTTEAWYDAHDPSTITDVGGIVDIWLDKSGNVKHLSQEIAGQKPSYVNNTITFGLDDNLDIAGALPTSYHMFVVGAPRVNTAIRTLLYSSAGNQPFVVNTGSDQVGHMAPGFSGPVVPVTWAEGERALIGFLSTANSFQKNGGPLSFIFSGSPDDRLTALGGNAGTDSEGFGDVNEIILVAVPASTETVQKLEGYLAWKWGFPHQLPDTHPYKRRPPMI